ncbi:MAG: hypothetical protein ABSA85_03055 [Terracidiphilus sp.]|jgi:hypothetical protein
MSPEKRVKLLKLALLPLCAALVATAGCGSSMVASNGGTQSNSSMGPAFVVGTDAPAPLPSVVGVKIQLESIVLTNGSTKSNNLLVNPVTVDFARYNGLQGLVDMNDVQTGTYTGVTIGLGTSNEIDYLSTGAAPPTISTLTPTLTTSSVNITLNNPLTVSATGGVPVGLRMDLDLGQSLETSGGGITGTVNPTFDVTTVARTDQGAHIDEFIGSVTTAPSSATATSFAITGPHGEAFTINISSSTEWDGGATESQLISDGSSAVVAVAGQFDPADQTLDADEIAIVSDTGFYAGGLVTYVTPTTGAATDMQFYVRHVLPSELSEVPLGGIANVSITGNEKYGIYWMHNAFTNLLFNDAALTAGQEISVGGPDPTASPFTVKRIHLRNWGYNGTIVAGSRNAAQGTFQMNVTGFAGQVIPSPITVYLGTGCDFRYGFGAFSDLTDNASIRVVGILLKFNGQTVLVARHVDGLTLTDTAVTAWQ